MAATCRVQHAIAQNLQIKLKAIAASALPTN